MLRNYVLIAWRNLKNNKIFSLINILGLTIGITSALLIAAFILQETDINREIRNVDRQYVLESEWQQTGLGSRITTISPLSKALKGQYPQLVANYCRLYGIFTNVSNGENHFREYAALVDSTLLSTFGFPLVAGQASKAFGQPTSVVITEDLAVKLWGKTDVVGKALRLETSNGEVNPAGHQYFTVTGVLANPRCNSVFNFFRMKNTVFLPMAGVKYFIDPRMVEDWNSPYMVSFLELRAGVQPGQLLAPMQKLIRAHAAEPIKKNLTPVLTPLRHYNLLEEDGKVGKMLRMLAWIGFLILSLAIINFVNLTIGKSAGRLREIGLRKALGGLRRQVMSQFMVESVLVTLLAFLLSLSLSQLLLPYFAQLVERPIALGQIPLGKILLLCLGLAVGTGVLAGVYPALVLSALPLIPSLKGKTSLVAKGQLLKRSLLAGQFGTAAFLLVAALIIHQQLSFLLGQNLGFEAGPVYTVSSLPRNYTPAGVDRMLALKKAFLQIPGVDAVTLSYHVPDGLLTDRVMLRREGQSDQAARSLGMIRVDEDYARTFHLKLLEGRFFTAAPAETPRPGTVVITRQAALDLGLGKNALGQKLYFPDSPDPVEVVGVVSDFHLNSLREKRAPLVLLHVKDAVSYRYYSFRLQGTAPKRALKQIGQKWAQLFPNSPVVGFHAREKFASLYATEQQLRKAVSLSSLLGLVVVFLGVLGLVLQSLLGRTKEIAIRRIMGASGWHVFILLNREFIGLLLAGTLLAFPLTYWVMKRWLAEFAYQHRLDSSPFLLSAAAVFSLSCLTVLIHALRAARKNPVEALRYE
jgi:putative ABC transport system permease protein